MAAGLAYTVISDTTRYESGDFGQARERALATGLPLYVRYDHAARETQSLVIALVFIAHAARGLTDNGFDLNDYEAAVIARIQKQISDAVVAAADAFGHAAFTEQLRVLDGSV